jgi:hypothetical protein
MGETKLIEKVLTGLLGRDMEKIKEIKIRWEDDVIISLQWSLHNSMEIGSAKILKLEGGGWQVLSSTI